METKTVKVLQRVQDERCRFEFFFSFVFFFTVGSVRFSDAYAIRGFQLQTYPGRYPREF